MLKKERKESFKNLLNKLVPIWRNGNIVVVLYTSNRAIQFDDFNETVSIDTFIDNVNIETLYIKTINEKLTISTKEFKSYAFNHANRTLTIYLDNDKSEKIHI